MKIKRHEAIFYNTTVYYIFNWALAKPIDIERFAAKLLSEGLARTVASPAREGIRIAPHYKDLTDLKKQIHKLEQLHDVRESRIDQTVWYMRHPILGYRLLRPHLGASTQQQTSRSDKDFLDIIREAEGTLDNVVAEAQSVNRIQQAIERTLYNPQYLYSEPYLRLSLRGFPCWLEMVDGGCRRTPEDVTSGVMAEVTLLVHRSGTLQLMIVLRLPDDLHTTDLVSLTMARETYITRSELAEPLIRASSKHIHASEKDWAGQWATGIADGTRWRQLKHDPPTNVSDMFETYRDAICGITGSTYFGEWLCYPVVAIDSLGCCSSERLWRLRHASDLKRITSRLSEDSRKPDITLPDESIGKNQSVYSSESSTTIIAWRFVRHQEYFEQHLYAILLVEQVLLGYWQLISLAERVLGARKNLRSGEAVQLEAIFGLQESTRSFLTYGGARDQSERLADRLGCDRLYRRIMDSLQLWQQFSSASQARRSTRTQNIVGAAAILAAIILGLPAIQQSLGIVKKIHRTGMLGAVTSPLRSLSQHGTTGVVEAYIGLMTVVLLVVVGSLFPRIRKTKLVRQRPPGIPWVRRKG